MIEFLPLLASATVGGIIGYSTNWVAIKMLFRPLTEKRFLGVKLPFTPGVIPKQRQALGTSIGDTVNEYLFTSEALVETLQTEAIKEKVSTFINRQLNQLQKSDCTIGELMTSLNIDPDKIATTLSQGLHEKINQKAFKEYLINTLDPITKSISTINIAGLLQYADPEQIAALQPKIVVLLTNYLNEKINTASEQAMIVNDLLPSEVKGFLKNILLFNTPQILGWLSEQFDKEDIRQLLEQYITDLLSGNFLGSILGGILPPATLSKMVCDKFKEGLLKPQALVFVQDKLDDILISFYNKEITTVLSDSVQTDLPNIVKELTESVYPQLYRRIIDIAESHRQLSIGEIADKLNIDVSKMVGQEILNSLELYLSDLENVTGILKPLLHLILAAPIASVTSRVGQEQVYSATEIFISVVTRFVDKHGKGFLEVLNIKGMVEKQINRLELLQVEQVVLSVMNNQLKTITRFGLLLGALLGLLMPVINSYF